MRLLMGRVALINAPVWRWCADQKPQVHEDALIKAAFWRGCADQSPGVAKDALIKCPVYRTKRAANGTFDQRADPEWRT